MTEGRISRRDFLKFLGSGSTVFVLGLFGINAFLGDQKKQHVASSQSAGSWDSPINQPDGTTTIHAALLANGKVLWIQGSGNHKPFAHGPFKHGIWNPDGGFSNTSTLSDDLFCTGMCTLANGNVLLAGGTLEFDADALNGKWHGGKFAYEADFSSGSIGNKTEMAHGRWYPTCVTLPDGKVFVVQGWDEYGVNSRLVEFYDPADKSWTIRLDPSGTLTYCVGAGQELYYPEAGTQCYGPGTAPYLSLYPRMHLLPSGLIASVGSENPNRVYNPETYKWHFAGNAAKRHYGTSILLPLENTTTEKGKILICGGSPTAGDPATSSAEIVTPSGTTGLSKRSTQSMAYSRKHLNPVILPTGEVVIFGGNGQGADYDTARLNPEAFDPVTETWTTWPAATVPRMYHSVALLLNDGRVWTAGTTPNQTELEVRVEIFNPWYTSETRPTISGDVTGGAYGDTITIPTPDGANISKVSLVKVSATTHHYNTDQRLIWLQIESQTASSVTAKAPINSKLAPPGYYLVHVLNSSGVPSSGKYIKIPGSADNSPPPPSDTTPPSQVTGLTITAAGSTQLDLGWTANTESDLDHYNVYRGTTAGFAVDPATDTPLAQPTTNSYPDTGLTASTTYYYKIAAVDTAGNIGTLSDEQSGTTSGGGTPTYTSIYSITGVNNYAKLYTGSLNRAGEYMQKNSTYNSVMIGQSVKKVKVLLKKSGSPTGTVSIVVRNSAGSIVHTFGTVDASTLSTSDQQFEREASSSYTIAANDRILVEWSGSGTSTDQVLVKKSASDTTGGFDGGATKWTQYATGYSNQHSYDLAGEWFKLA